MNSECMVVLSVRTSQCERLFVVVPASVSGAKASPLQRPQHLHSLMVRTQPLLAGHERFESHFEEPTFGFHSWTTKQ